MPATKPVRVFISHTGAPAHAEAAAFAALLDDELRRRGVETIFRAERKQHASKRWKEQLEEDIDAAVAFVSVLCPLYTQQYWRMQELALALARHNKEQQEIAHLQENKQPVDPNKPRLTVVPISFVDGDIDIPEVLRFWLDESEGGPLAALDDAQRSFLDAKVWAANVQQAEDMISTDKGILACDQEGPMLQLRDQVTKSACATRVDTDDLIENRVWTASKLPERQGHHADAT